MAVRKYTLGQGKGVKDVVEAAGSVIAGGSAVEVNIDYTKMSQAEVAVAIDQIKARIVQGKWPPV
jgi:hypothetical protein